MATFLNPLSGKLKSTSTPTRRYHPYTRMIRKEVHRVYDRIYATVYGHCIGDAFGLLTETLTRDETKKKYREVYHKFELVHKKILPDSHRRKWKIGDWTDESDIMILILQSILKNKGEVIPIDFAKRLIEWSEHGFPELGDMCGLGTCPQVKAVINHPQFSETPEKAAEIVWRDSRKLLATNSAISRTAVIGVHCYHTIGKVIKHTLDICKVTHPDIRCQASCVAVTVAIALMLQKNERHIKKNGNYNVDGIIDETYKYAARILSTTEEVKELKRYMSYCSLKDLKLDEPGRTNYTYKTLGAGLWALRQKDFRQAIQDILLEGGDADANAAVAGALLGCKLGVEAIPPTWIESLSHRMWLDDILDGYFDILEGRKTSKETTL
ncbi:ADP-ribosylarginine hydrolase Tri1-like [Pecten maximus]|uniref:ADP-ribosylarginine hydrolase Tri1-like n=1 Tax=Pecten maximus TaxID=6579 RepID=UPI001459120B|nr:ADP-ribosylarginine hydrolase Tri1-like [Pecten maximus]